MLSISRRIAARSLLCAASAVAIAAQTAPVHAQVSSNQQVTIEAQSLGDALIEVGRRYGASIYADDALTRGKRAPRVSGTLNAEQAIARLLAGSGLTYERSQGGFVITRRSAARPRPSTTPGQEQPARADRAAQEQDAEPSIIVVTGTNIRGVVPDSSPLEVFSREDVIATGQPTAQDFVLTIPQNFGGGSTARSTFGIPGDVASSQNSLLNGGLGSSVNLRGLGSGATLVLLNGRRLPPASATGNFADISFIPATAIERVEVVLDGASSIYGADAVAGVSNFVLRDDFDGIEASFRFGTPTDGGFEEYRAGLVAGGNWNSGGIVASYEYFNQGNLASTDREVGSELLTPTDILPQQERHSVLVSAYQELTSNFTFDADVLYGTRDTIAFQNLPGIRRIGRPESETLSIAGGVTWDVSADWSLSLGGSFGFTDTLQFAEQFNAGPNPGEEIDNSFSADIRSELSTFDASLTGSLFSLPGGDVKLAVGGQLRLEDFENIADDGTTNRSADRDVLSIFGEVFIPVFGTGNDRPGLERLELTVSGRLEDYSDFGTTTNPKVGVLWQPVEQLRLRGSYSTSFAAPALGLVGAIDRGSFSSRVGVLNNLFGFPTPPEIADDIALTLFGTGSSLDAERSTSWSVGADFNDEWGPTRVRFSLNWFDIDFTDRLSQTPVPGFNNSFAAVGFDFSNPGVLPAGTVIFNASSDQVRDALGQTNIPGFSFDGSDSLDATIINFAPLTRNVSNTQINGLDFSIGADLDLPDGSLTIGVNGAYISSFETRATENSPTTVIVNTLYRPVDLVLRGNVGYSSGGFSSNIFINYTDDYRVSEDPLSARIDDDLTFDLSLVYDFGKRDDTALDGLSLRLFLINALNEAPPVTPTAPVTNIGSYDPANASAVGRFFAIEVAKRF